MSLKRYRFYFGDLEQWEDGDWIRYAVVAPMIEAVKLAIKEIGHMTLCPPRENCAECDARRILEKALKEIDK